jgi:hypothetical protein
MIPSPSLVVIDFHPGRRLFVSTSVFVLFAFGSPVASDSLFFPTVAASGGLGSGRQYLDPDPHPYSRFSFFLRAVLFLSSQDWYLDFLSAGILLAPTWLVALAQSGKQ